MEKVLPEDAKKKLAEILSAFNELIEAVKKLPSDNPPPEVLSPAYPIDIFLDNLRSLSTKLMKY